MFLFVIHYLLICLYASMIPSLTAYFIIKYEIIIKINVAPIPFIFINPPICYSVIEIKFYIYISIIFMCSLEEIGDLTLLKSKKYRKAL